MSWAMSDAAAVTAKQAESENPASRVIWPASVPTGTTAPA